MEAPSMWKSFSLYFNPHLLLREHGEIMFSVDRVLLMQFILHCACIIYREPRSIHFIHECMFWSIGSTIHVSLWVCAMLLFSPLSPVHIIMFSFSTFIKYIFNPKIMLTAHNDLIRRSAGWLWPLWGVFYEGVNSHLLF